MEPPGCGRNARHRRAKADARSRRQHRSSLSVHSRGRGTPRPVHSRRRSIAVASCSPRWIGRNWCARHDLLGMCASLTSGSCAAMQGRT
eukprot:6405260-Amphidinium_carterae.1